MQATVGAHQLDPGPQVEVIRVGQHHLGADGTQRGRRDGFDGGLGADRHETGGEDLAVRGLQAAGAGPAAGGFELKAEGAGGHHEGASVPPQASMASPKL